MLKEKRRVTGMDTADPQNLNPNDRRKSLCRDLPTREISITGKGPWRL